MHKIPLVLLMAGCIAAVPAAAQDSTKPVRAEEHRTLRERIPASVTQTDQDNVLSVVVENDMFGGGTDQNYTSGVRLTYLDISSDFPELARVIADYIPGFEINDTSSLYYSLGQNLYTPRNIEQVLQDPNDRPWAGYLYGSMGMVTFTDNHMDEIELSLGVVGPAAMGEQTQKFIHEHVSNSPEPLGWDNQLDNEPTIMLGWQRTFRQYLAGDVAGLSWSVAPYGGITIGNVYTYADAGFNFRIGPSTERWQDTPMRVRPAMPGTGFYEIPDDQWSWYVFAGVEGRAVAHNIFLDGNTFTDSHSVDKNWLVGDANIGLAMTYDKVRISYTAVYRTKEFEDQSDPEIFGAITVGYRF